MGRAREALFGILVVVSWESYFAIARIGDAILAFIGKVRGNPPSL